MNILNLRKKLCYCAALVPLFVASPTISASIIYSGVQNVSLPHFSDESISFSLAESPDEFFIGDERENFLVWSEGTNNHYATFGQTSPRRVTSLEFGESIDSSGDWVSISSRSRLAAYGEDFSADARGGFFDQADGFMALRIAYDDETYYGWLRMSHSMAEERLTIHDWAWNSTSGEPIMAGEIPEPAVYALILGMGALGAVVWRRRRLRSER